MYSFHAKEKSTPEKELQRALDQLYEKCVPAEMREYLELFEGCNYVVSLCDYVRKRGEGVRNRSRAFFGRL